MPDRPSRRRTPAPANTSPRSPRLAHRLSLALQLGAAAVLLAACSGSGKNLIPASNAGPLQNDFEAVAQAAQDGNGSCAETTAAIRKTEQDLAALPTSVAVSLRNTLSEGVANLSTRALDLCARVTTTTSSTTSMTKATTQTTSTSSTSETTTTETSSTSTPTTSAAGGGTPVPGETTTSTTGETPPADNGAGGAPVAAEGPK